MTDLLPYPLLGVVGQAEMKTALTLALINPAVGGVLLSGPYGVGKTTSVRGLLDIMPTVLRPRCDHHCPIEFSDLMELCADCRAWLKKPEPRIIADQMRLMELPLNARLEDVVGGLNERVAIEQQRVLLEHGILARAHHNVLYIDEINLLDPSMLDLILDAAAQGRTYVRRGAMTRLFPSQFVLIGSMNPEEGALRPQIMDRLGLRVWVAPQTEASLRLEIYRRAVAFRQDHEHFRTIYADQTATLKHEIDIARAMLPDVTIDPQAEELTIKAISALNIPSHRAEIVTLEAARSRAAADERRIATIEDVQAVAPLALRWRTSNTIIEALERDQLEQTHIKEILQASLKKPRKRRNTSAKPLTSN